MDKQQTSGWCGPAVLVHALKQRGIKTNQEEIAKHTGTTIKDGVDPEKLTSFLKKYGFDTKTYSGSSPMKTLQTMNIAIDKDKQVIVDYLDGDNINKDGHYSLYKGMKSGKVLLWDPYIGKDKTMSVDDFISSWKDKKINGGVFKYWTLIF